MVAKWREGMESAETPLARLRRRIVFFLGSLGGLNGGMVERGPAALQAEKVIAWDSKSRLEFALPFQDMKPSIYLGKGQVVGVYMYVMKGRKRWC